MMRYVGPPTAQVLICKWLREIEKERKRERERDAEAWRRFSIQFSHLVTPIVTLEAARESRPRDGSKSDWLLGVSHSDVN